MRVGGAPRNARCKVPQGGRAVIADVGNQDGGPLFAYCTFLLPCELGGYNSTRNGQQEEEREATTSSTTNKRK